MFDGCDSERWDGEPETVRRQVILSVYTVIDVPVSMTEDEVRKLVSEETCRRDIIMQLADEIVYDSEQRKAGKRPLDKTQLCAVCKLSTVKLLPKEEELQEEWLEHFGYSDEDEDEEGD